MDWLVMVPLLLIGILLVMKLSDADYPATAWNLGVDSAFMIVSGYYGELAIIADPSILLSLVPLHLHILLFL